MDVTSFPHVDEFSAGIKAPNMVLVARNTSHNRGYTVAGLLITASVFFVCLLMVLLVFAAVSVGLVATAAGGVLIDLFSGVTARMVRPCEDIVTTAVLASSVYTLVALFYEGQGFFPITVVAVGTAFVFGVFSVREHWAQIVPLAAPAEGPWAQSESLLKKTA